MVDLSLSRASQPPRNGTLLSRNLFSMSYNYAAAEGNQRQLRTLDAYLSARAANCSAEVRDAPLPPPTPWGPTHGDLAPTRYDDVAGARLKCSTARERAGDA